MNKRAQKTRRACHEAALRVVAHQSAAGVPTLSMISSQASMQVAQPMHSICRPLRMSMPVGQTWTQRRQSTQSPVACSAVLARLAAAARRSR